MLLLRIPHRLAGKQDPVLHLLRHKRKRLSLFSLRSQERRFCSQFLQSYSNWWLFRCNQKKSLGDFIIVDMSSPALHLRSVWVVELKFNERVHHKKGFQLRNSHLGIQKLIQRQLITETSPVHHIHGSGKLLLHSLKDHDLQQC